MNQTTLIAIVAVFVIAIAIGLWMMTTRRRTDRLRDRFGDEYDRTVETVGNRTEAEAALAEREKRVEALTIRPLTATEHRQFADEWTGIKAVFVDSPIEAVLHADRLLATMMKTVGYPMADFDRRYEDLTVNHGDVARHYREGRQIVDRHTSGGVSTEEMRQAMKHYEALFDRLVSNAEAGTAATVAPADPVPAERVDDGRVVSTTDTTTTTKATDLDGDGDADVVRQDTNGNGLSDRIRLVAD